MKKTFVCNTCNKRVRTSKKPLFDYLSHRSCPKLRQRMLKEKTQ